MTVLGLHIVDILIIVFYLLSMLYIGQRLSKKVSGETDFYLAGRKLGKMYQFFLMFGGATDANGAATVATEVFRQGASGIWIGLQMMFATPFYWFYCVWFRRVRLISQADLFEDRFGNRRLATVFAIYAIIYASSYVGFGYFAAGKTMQAILTKSPDNYSPAEKQMVSDFAEYNEIKKQIAANTASNEQFSRHKVLDNLYRHGKLKGYVSYISDMPIVFYIIYGGVVAFYVITGGFRAAVVTNVVQGLLIIVFSVMLIPIGLSHLGGFEGLHSKVPAYMFDIVGSAQLSDYKWYSIATMILLMAISVNGSYSNMANSGSATDEYAARLGCVTGAFGKRFMMLAWTISGLIAYGLFKDKIADADQTWGFLSKSLLGTGLMGVMIAGILAANMSSMDGSSLCISALFVRNLYTPIFPNKTEKHYVLVGRVAIFLTLTLGLIIALNSNSIISLTKVLMALPVAFGSVVMLLFYWRKLTVTAIYAEVISYLFIFVILPAILVQSQEFRQMPSLTTQTVINAQTQTIVPMDVFFDSVARTDPDDPASPYIGIGRFNIEVYITSLFGVPVEKFSKAGLLTTRFMFSVIYPFAALIIVSLFTRPPSKEVLDRFFVRMKTPVAPTLELDDIEVQKGYDMPARFDGQKLFPRSNWEFCKWTREDTYGFVLCWVAVFVVMWMFKAILNIGA